MICKTFKETDIYRLICVHIWDFQRNGHLWDNLRTYIGFSKKRTFIG